MRIFQGINKKATRLQSSKTSGENIFSPDIVATDCKL